MKLECKKFLYYVLPIESGHHCIDDRKIKIHKRRICSSCPKFSYFLDCLILGEMIFLHDLGDDFVFGHTISFTDIHKCSDQLTDSFLAA